MKCVIEICRHGARAPTRPFPFLHSLWQSLPLGSLTNTGAKQQFSLGARLRQRYADSLLPTHYSPQQMQVVSSSTARAKDSGLWQLFGFYPHLAKEVIGVDVTLDTIDMQMVSRVRQWPLEVNDKLLKGYKHYENRAVDELETVQCSEYQQKEQAWLSSFFPAVSKAVGFQVSSITEAADISSAIDCELAAGLPLPIGVSESMYAELQKTHAFEKFNIPFRKREACVTSVNALFSDIMTVMNKQQPRFKLYSGHDTTLAAVLMYIGVQMEVVPAFASTLLLELDDKGTVHCSFNDKAISGRYLQFPCKLQELQGRLSSSKLS